MTLAHGDKLLSKMEEYILDNLDNQQFGVESLAEMMGTSRSNLHRIVKSRTGNNVSCFIRYVRLNRALKFLLDENTTIAEIGFRVGFNSNTYFTKCFSDLYGIPPGEARDILREKTNVKDGTHADIILHDLRIQPEQGALRDVSRSIWRNSFAWIIFFVFVVISTVISYQGFKKVPASVLSMAILPVEVVSENGDQSYLDIGIQDGLIHELSMIKQLRVISRNSSMHIDETNKTLAGVGAGLGVDILIKTSVFLYGDSLRVRVQLLEKNNQEDQWNREYFQSLSEILSLYREIALDVAEELELELRTYDVDRLQRARSVDKEMYKAFLRGIYFINQSTPADFNKGIMYLQEAIRIDPAEPMAYAKLAVGYNSINHGPEPAVEYWKLAKAAAERAITLDSTLAEAHAALAMIKAYLEHDWVGAEKAYKTALNNNPNLAVAHFHYAWFLVVEGRLEEAFYHNRIARELDPLLPIYTADLGSLHHWAREYEEAESLAREALALNERFGHAWFVLGNALVQQGRFKEAILAHKKAYSINSSWRWLLGNTYAVAGEKAKALEIVSQLEKEPVSTRNAFGLAWIYMSLGNMDKAFKWINREPFDPWTIALTTWPEFEPMRRDSRFPELMRKIRIFYEHETQKWRMDRRPLHNLNDPPI